MLKNIQGHPNLVKLREIIPEGTVETMDNHKLHVDYAMALEAIKGGELSYNMYKFGRLNP